MGFKDIEFGMEAAEKEHSIKPYLLIDGFLDAYGYIDELRNGHKFLVLGSKGSGKSAISSKLQLLSDNDNLLYVNSYDLESFPYNSFSGLLPGAEAPETKYPISWEFILLIALLESFSQDRSLIKSGRIDRNALIKCLQELGMTSGKTLLNEIVRTTTKRDFKVSLPKILECAYSSEMETRNANIIQLLTSLREACYNVRTSSSHIVIIDGLDDVLTKREVQYRSLSALITAADRINNKFILNRVKAKVIILCRTDLFEKLPGSNKNKIRQDSAINLNWYQDVKDPKSTNLIKLINLRAKNSLKKDVDIFKEFFPQRIRHDDSTAKTLIDNTRHTPRDIIQLLNKIKDHTSGEKPTLNEIKNGLRTYSFDYLVPEIRDELDGYLTTDEIENTIKLLSSMKSNRFSFKELDDKKQKDIRFSSLNLPDILNALFNCNVIGNVGKEKRGKNEVYSWKYRNRYATFDLEEGIVIHIGLGKGLNLF